RHAIERTLSPRFYDSQTFGQSLLSDVVGARAYMAGKARHITGIQARGDRFTIHLTARAPDLPARLATSPFCAAPPATPIRPLSGPIPSAGPYFIASVTPRRGFSRWGNFAGFVLLRNPNYHGDRPHRLQRIEVVFGAAYPVAQIEASKLDYAFGD